MKLLPTLFLLVFIQGAVATACSEVIPIDSKKRKQTIELNCKPLYMAVKNGKINVIKKIIKTKTQKNQLACIKYALHQTSPTGRKTQFQAFQYLAKKLIAMKLPDQQIIFNKVLQDYAIVYLSDSPEYTEYLLSVGALPKTPNKYGKLPVAAALWAVNDYGDCKTPSLLINASSPKILAHQNKAGETALMQSIDKGSICTDELKLLAQKSAGLNLFDQHGNTALHHLMIEMKRSMDSSSGEVRAINLAQLRILRKRGASFKIPNKQSITPYQLLRELKRKGCKCY